MPSYYVLHHVNQLPDLSTTTVAEGNLFPLLRWTDDSDAELNWAYAVPRPRGGSGSPIADRRRHRLVCSILRALGFRLDAENANSTGRFAGYDFFHLPDALPVAERLIDRIPKGVFDGTLPDKPTGGTGLQVNDPVLPAEQLRLKAGTLAKVAFPTKSAARFGVSQFRFREVGNTGEFVLGTEGSDTSPEVLNVKCVPDPDLAAVFPHKDFVPELKFEQTVGGHDMGTLRCNNEAVIPNNTKDVAADVRHDRMVTATAVLVSELPSDAGGAALAAYSLAVEIFPSFTFQPRPELPVTVTVGHRGVTLRLAPRAADGKSGPSQGKVNHLAPCVRVVVRGPSVHADASTSGVLEALSLLEPAERAFEDTVEKFNDFMTYSFDVCLPAAKVPGLTLPELLRLDAIRFDLPNWPSAHPRLPTLAEFFRRLGVTGLALDADLTVSPVEIDLKDFGLSFADLKAQLGLPELNVPGDWSQVLRFRRPDLDGELIPAVNISANLTVTGPKLRVPFGSIPPLHTLELHLPAKFPLDGFDFRLPDIALPSLTEFELPFARIDDFHLQVKMPGGVDITGVALGQWTVRLRTPAGLKIPLLLTDVTISGLDVTFEFSDLLPALPDPSLDRLVVKWALKPFGPIDYKVPVVTFATKLPRLDAAFDVRLLKLRAIRAGLEIGTFGVLELMAGLKQVRLDLPAVDGQFPALAVFDLTLHTDVTFEFSVDVALSLATCSLTDLLGELPSVEFRLSAPRLAPLPGVKGFDIEAAAPRFSLGDILGRFGRLDTPIIPFELAVRIPRPGVPKAKWDELRLILGFHFDLKGLRLLNNRIYFFLPQVRGAAADRAPRQVVECDIFTLTFPNRPDPLGFPTVTDHDGYLDLNSHTLVVELKYPKEKAPKPPPRILAYFPGGMDPRAARLGREGVYGLDDAAAFPAADGLQATTGEVLKLEYAKRFELEFDTIDPTFWPNTGPDLLSFRLNPKGLTLAATLGKTEVLVDNSGFKTDGKPDGVNTGLIKPFKLQPQDKLRELKSRFVVIDNELKEAGLYAKTEVPGVDGLMAEVSVALRQAKKGALPEVVATLELERADQAAIAELSIKLLQLSLERIQLGLVWRREEREWDYSVIADGTIAFTGAAVLVPDLEGLRAPSIQVIGLDLRRLNVRQLRVPLRLVRPVRFDILDGLFGVELGDLEVAWEFDGGLPKPRLLACELAKLEFKYPGALEVAITVGGLHIEFAPDLSAHVRLPSSLGIEVAFGPTARYAGRVGWVETDVERYLFASGRVTLQGFPEFQALLKFGTGLKLNGRREINLVLFGEAELDETLFAGAVVKSLGLGVGLNNRLAVVPPHPSAEQVLARIDQLDPGAVEGWQFVRDGGFYLSVVGAVTLASNVGGPGVLNPYVARVVASFDTNFDLVAAGKLWLSCSLGGVRSYPNNPAFVGVMVLSPGQRKLELQLRSRKNAYVEQNDLIKRLLDKGDVRFAFRMTPELVDFHLAELSYVDQMFGVQMEFRGEYRFAIYRRAVLLKSELSASGRVSRSLTAGPGGFDLDGEAHLAVGYGGLLSDTGVMAYAFLDAGIRFRVSAWIEIGFSISFRICGKRFSVSWSEVFRLRVPELELSFRGAIAAADRGGLVGVDVQVGINVVICGYALRASGRLAVNPELYQEVRGRVAAFEAELNEAVKKLEGKKAGGGPAFGPPQVLAAAAADAEPVEERWVLYTRALADRTAVLLMPTPQARWLTPTIASVDEVTLRLDGAVVVAAFHVHAPLPPVATSDQVTLLGMRGRAEQLARLDGTWKVLRVLTPAGRSTIELDVTDSKVTVAAPPERHALFGGVWSVVAALTGVDAADHATVPYLDDVERVVLPLVGPTGWLTVAAFKPDSGILTTNGNHGLEGTLRVVFRKDGAGTVIDRGGPQRTRTVDVGPVTFRAVRVGDDTLKLTDFDKTIDAAPQAGWECAPALEVAPPWNRRNRLAAVRGNWIGADKYPAFTRAAANWAETAARDEGVPERLVAPDYEVVFDKRYASTDPRYTDQEVEVYPGVLSARFRAPDEVRVVGADVVLKSAREYEEARAALARQELHGALDLLDDETLPQARAQASNLLLHRFSDPAGLRPGDHPEAPFVPDADAAAGGIVFGWSFSVGDEFAGKYIAPGNDLFVRRTGGAAAKVALDGAAPDPGPGRNDQPITLPIRQEFLVDRTDATRETGRVSVKLPVRFPDEWLTQTPEKIGRFQILRRVGTGPEVVVADHLRPDVSYLKTADGRTVVVPKPVLFSDDFAVIDREFVDRDLQGLRGDGTFPTATYTLRAVPEGDAGGAAGVTVPWAERVPIFIPRVPDFPPNLAVAVAVESLIDGNPFRFQLVDMSGEFPVPARRDRRPLDPAAVEVGLDGEDLKQTGFFLGEEPDAAPRRDADGSTLTLDRVRVREDIESEVGKVVVGLKGVSGAPDRFALASDAALVVGRSYRVFLRPTADTAVRSLRRVPVLVLREFPARWDETVRYQVHDTLERVPVGHLARVRGAVAEPLRFDFSADDLYAAGRPAVRVAWPSLTLMDGGVELQFRDFDDSAVRARSLVEVVEADKFRTLRQDFRDEDQWAPRPADRVDGYAARVRTTPAVPSADELKNVYLWRRGDTTEVDRIRWLKVATDELKNLKPTASWANVAEKVRGVQVALLAFEKSPLNLNDPVTRRQAEGVRHGLRALLVGNRAELTPRPDDTVVARLRADTQKFLDVLTRVEQSRPEAVGGDADEAVFLDRDTSRKLAGIVRRRIAIADEVVGLRQQASVPRYARLHSGELVVRQAAWDAVSDDALSLQPTLPATLELRGLVAVSDAWWTAQLKAVGDTLDALLDVLDDQKETLAGFVPRAAGLSEFLDRLDKELKDGDPDSLAVVLKRPHHELTTSKDELGMTIASPLPLRTFLPPDARRAKPGEVPPPPDERLDRLGLRVGQVVTLDAAGVVSLWTTRGDSVRNQPVRRVQQFHVGAGATGVELAETADGPCVLVGFGDRQEVWDAATASRLLTVPGAPAGAFARTPRGLEVLMSEPAGLQLRVRLRSVESPGREPLTFTNGEAHAGPVAYHDEARFVAAGTGSTLAIWRDLGRPTNPTPRRSDDLGAPVVAVRPVTLPVGPRFVVATEQRVLCVDPETGRVDPTAFVPGGSTIVALAVDRRGLTVTLPPEAGGTPADRWVLPAAVRLENGRVKAYDLVGGRLVTDLAGAGRGLAVLHGRHDGTDTSYLVVPDTAGAVGLYDPDDVEPVQTLSKSSDLTTTGVVTAVSAALPTARSAPAAADVVNLFHLWERLGFALDVAAQDGTTRLLEFNELRGHVHAVVSGLPDAGARPGFRFKFQGEIHFVYVVEGEEPDADFRGKDRVGFSHLKVALVPERFLKAALAVTVERTTGTLTKAAGGGVLAVPRVPASPANVYQAYFLDGPLKGKDYRATPLPDGTLAVTFGDAIPDEPVRGLDVLVVPAETSAAGPALEKWLSHRSVMPSADAAAKWVELAHVSHLTRLVGVPTADRLGDRSGAEAFDNCTVRLQPRAERFVRVPASAGLSHWAWPLPDRKGHRIMAAARRVSRYEPLLRWWLNLHTRFDLPEEVPLGPDVLTVTPSTTPGTVKVDKPLPEPTWWQPPRLEITAGTGAGQSRELTAVTASELTFDPGDPLLLGAGGSTGRIVVAADGWRMVPIDPIHDPALGEGPRPLMVYQYPHARRPRFSYQLPLDGMRSTYNQISRVRTGYHGVELAFRYFLPVRVAGKEPALADLLARVVVSADTGVPAPRRTTRAVSPGPEAVVRLFRHERLASLPELPFFYRYRLDVRSAYQSRLLEHDRVTPADLLPTDENLSPPAARLPAGLGMNDLRWRPGDPLLAGILPADQPGGGARVKLPPAADPLPADDTRPAGGLRLRVGPPAEGAWYERQVAEWGADGTVTLTPPFAAAEEPAAGWFFELYADGFEVTLFASANRDHLTREEAASEPAAVATAVEPAGGGAKYDVAARDLPDFFMEYTLVALAIPGAAPVASRGDVFTAVGSVRMPWSPNFPPPSAAPPDRPFVSLTTNLLLGARPAHGPLTLTGQEGSVALERVTIGGTWYWRLRFWVVNARKVSVVNTDVTKRVTNLFVEGLRDGRRTWAAPAKGEAGRAA